MAAHRAVVMRRVANHSDRVLRQMERCHAAIAQALKRLRDSLSEVKERDMSDTLRAVTRCARSLEQQVNQSCALGHERLIPALLTAFPRGRLVASVVVREYRELHTMAHRVIETAHAVRGAPNGRQRQRELVALRRLANESEGLWRRVAAKERKLLFPLAVKSLGDEDWRKLAQ